LFYIATVFFYAEIDLRSNKNDKQNKIFNELYG